MEPFPLGNTPLILVDGIYAKLECVNPCGSIKDRIAKYIIDKSEQKGLLRQGMHVVEATSGNTGIALTYYARLKGYPVTIVMPEHMTEERKRLLQELGAQLVLTDAEGSFAKAARVRDVIAMKEGYFSTDQFSNPLNVECHYQTTGREILSQLKPHVRSIDAIVAGVGTGGTLIGVGTLLKERYPEVQVVAVEPDESAVMTGGQPGRHCIPGIGDGFIPAIASNGNGMLNQLIDSVIRIPSKDAMAAAHYLRKEHDLCVGISSGANFLAAQKLKAGLETVVTVFPDGHSRYCSEGLQESQHCPYKARCAATRR